jgi:uncharacterized protein with FMN-binding domain
MIRTTVPTSIRKGAAVVGVTGLLVLAGCSGAADAEPNTDDTASNADADSTGSGEYADGTYTAEGSYQTPETIEEISVTLTLEDGVVMEAEVTGDPQARETEQYQGEFIAGIEQEVVGVPIDELNVSRVAGSSLTSAGFNAAVEDIKDQAAA